MATVSMLAALAGAESQLQSHIRISLNVGLTVKEMRHVGEVPAERVDAESARRTREALRRHLKSTTGG